MLDLKLVKLTITGKKDKTLQKSQSCPKCQKLPEMSKVAEHPVSKPSLQSEM
jgi:hypothetical protein